MAEISFKKMCIGDVNLSNLWILPVVQTKKFFNLQDLASWTNACIAKMPLSNIHVAFCGMHNRSMIILGMVHMQDD